MTRDDSRGRLQATAKSGPRLSTGRSADERVDYHEKSSLGT